MTKWGYLYGKLLACSVYNINININVALQFVQFEPVLPHLTKWGVFTGIYLPAPQPDTVRAMVANLAHVSLASSLYHGSRTRLGGNVDRKFMDLFAFAVYKAATDGFLHSSNFAIAHLSNSSRLATQPTLLSLI